MALPLSLNRSPTKHPSSYLSTAAYWNMAARFRGILEREAAMRMPPDDSIDFATDTLYHAARNLHAYDAATGPQGLRTARACAAKTSQLLGIPAERKSRRGSAKIG